ncbi:uncharacterized protein LOC134665476 [Cydia fagiglandana]|uniref:uncharacterized protein LOC134665476 n=1 Tax=Cydia fagiglandana TaxID=1458189 RepID=UPI002FEE2618
MPATYSRGSKNFTYPSNPWHHSYPGPGSSNSGYYRYPVNAGNSSNGTANIQHYYYNPPSQIHYASIDGEPVLTYPVYRGSLPSYVYQYRFSGTRYGTLLAGLALFNLGVLNFVTSGLSVGHSSPSDNKNYLNYKAQPGEVCLFGINKDNGDFEETRIDCQPISSFIYAEQAKQQQPQNSQNQTTVTTTVTNTTIVNATNPQDTPSYVLSPNGTLVTPGAAPDAGNVTNGAPATGGSVTSSVTVTTTNTMVVNAFETKGSPIELKPGMQCYVKRKTPYSVMKNNIPCALLQAYADKYFSISSDFNAEIIRPALNHNGDDVERNYSISWDEGTAAAVVDDDHATHTTTIALVYVIGTNNKQVATRAVSYGQTTVTILRNKLFTRRLEAGHK